LIDIQEILKKVRYIEIRTRKMVNEVFAGRYQSAFKGTGMEFSDVRLYQPGDDFRSIDWNVTSRTGEVHVKQFQEEREMTILFAVDVSPSMRFGTHERMKSEVVAEVCALLAFSAVRNQDRVGLLLFSGEIELYIPPRKGREHVLRIIREVLYFEPKGRGTDFPQAFSTLSSLLPRRGTLFLCSDFLSPLSTGFPVLCRRHDVTSIWVEDPAERELPPSGWVEVVDPESGTTTWADLGSGSLRNRYRETRGRQRTSIRESILRSGSDLIHLSTGEDFTVPLIRFFQERARRMAS